MAYLPHPALSVVTPDQVAECWDGVIAQEGLYETLWSLTEHYDNAHLEVIEDIGPGDVVGINSVASFWDRLDEQTQERLNKLAQEMDVKLGEFPVEDWQYEVANGDTRLGYLEWRVGKREIPS